MLKNTEEEFEDWDLEEPSLLGRILVIGGALLILVLVLVVKLPYGAVVKRTGINTDVGWSRVEYEGQTLYCVSSYVYVVEE